MSMSTGMRMEQSKAKTGLATTETRLLEQGQGLIQERIELQQQGNVSVKETVRRWQLHHALYMHGYENKSEVKTAKNAAGLFSRQSHAFTNICDTGKVRERDRLLKLRPQLRLHMHALKQHISTGKIIEY